MTGNILFPVTGNIVRENVSSDKDIFPDKDKICILTGNIYCHTKYLIRQENISCDRKNISCDRNNIHRYKK